MENIQEDVENKIIDCIVLGSNGRLIVFKPEEHKNGTDLAVKRKGEYEPEENKSIVEQKVVRAQAFGSVSKKNKEEMFVSVSGQIKTDEKSIFIKDINIGESGLDKKAYLLFVFFNLVKHDIDDYVCILQLEKFKKIATATKDRNILKFESYLSPEKKDKYTDFLINKKELAHFFLGMT